MKDLKQWVALSVAATLAVAAAGWFLLVNPRRTEAADLRAQAVSQEQANAGKAGQLARLRAQAKGLPAQQARLAAVATKIPEDPALPSLIRTLSASAEEAGVELVGLQPQPPVAVGAPAAAGAPADAAGAAGAPDSTGLSAIPLTIAVTGGYFAVEQFVAALEDRPRAVQVTGMDLTPLTGADAAEGESEDDGALRATLTARVFLAARPPATAVGAGSGTVPGTVPAAVPVPVPAPVAGAPTTPAAG